MRKLLNLVTKEISGLHEAAYLLGISALASQILALIRDRLFASSFGAGQVLDIYYASFRIPDIIFAVISSMVSVSILAPFLAKKMTAGKEEVRNFLDSLFSLFSVVIAVISIVLFILMPYIAKIAFEGLDDVGILVNMSRILLLSPILLGVSNIYASIVQLKNRFTLSALSPILYNLGIISGIIFFYPVFGIYGLAFGVIIGALLHAIVQIPFLKREGLVPGFKLRVDFESIRDVVKLALPRSLTLSTNQLAMFFLVSFASLLTTGSVAVFSLSFNLQAVPIAIIGASYSVAVFPRLSKFFAEGNMEEFLKKTLETARHILFWSLPVAILLMILRLEAVRVIFGYGRFSAEDANLTAYALSIFAFAIVPQGLILLFVRALYALGKTSKPLILNVVSAVFTVLLAISGLSYIGKVPELVSYTVLVLPISYSIGSILNVILHYYSFKSEFTLFSSPFLKSFWKIFGASLVAGYGSGLLANWIRGSFAIEGFFAMISFSVIVALVFILLYAMVLKFLKSEELAEVIISVKRRFGREKLVANNDSI